MRGLAIDYRFGWMPKTLGLWWRKSPQGKNRTDYTLAISLYLFTLKVKVKDHRQGTGFKEKPSGWFLPIR